MYLAEDLIAPGGPSAPVWAFFTAISLAIIGLFGQLIATKREARATRDEAIQAKENTINVSNGFTARMDRKLDSIMQWQLDHQEYHLKQGEQK